MNSKTPKKTKHTRAVALRYNTQKDFAPRIAARGEGLLAERILQRARDHDVAVYENERLVNELLQFELGTEIPPELYEIVAQILVFVEAVDEEKGQTTMNRAGGP